MLEAAGYRVRAPEVGCCGMAGIFGHEIDNQGLSSGLWHASWADQMATARAKGAVVVATGYSCRSQAERFAGARPLHPVELLAPI